MAVHAERAESLGGSKIVTLTIDRPPVNALDIHHLELLTTRVRSLAHDADTSGVVITGIVDSFSAGVDIKEIEGQSGRDRHRLFSVIDDMVAALLDLEIPVGAAVNGHALGGGLVLALLADVRLVATGDYRLGLPEVAMGVRFPPMAAEVVRRELQPTLVRHLAVGGKTITPSEAVDLRLFDEIVDPATLLHVTRNQVAGLADLPGFAEVKRQLRCRQNGDGR